jgi:hypothetical protein
MVRHDDAGSSGLGSPLRIVGADDAIEQYREGGD